MRLQAFASSVNSPLKPPTQNANKDGTANTNNINRRTSITQNPMNNSPSNRPAPRRRESGGDLLQNSNPLISPTSNRFSKDDPTISSPPASLLRRKTDFKESFGPSLEEKERKATRPGIDTSSPFGSLKRTNTNPVSASLNGPSSPWSGAPPSAGFSPMGAFGNFALGGASAQTPISAEKKAGFGSVRGESRFKGLMNASSSEDLGSKMREKSSMNSLERLSETNEQNQSRWAGNNLAQPRGINADLYGDEDDFGAGSAALGADEASPPLPQSSRYRNPDRQASYDEIGFSSLGASSDLPPFRELMQRRDYPQQENTQIRAQGMGQMEEPMSPTTTNPYQSPEGEKRRPDDIDTDDSDILNMQHPAAGQYSHAARGFQNPLDSSAGDRSQTSSTGAGRGFPSLGSLGSLSGLSGPGAWSAAPGAIGTPSRAQPNYSAAFGDTFNTMNDLSSPQSGLSGSGLFGAGSTATLGGAGPIGRSSKLSSLLPNAMQEQMRAERQDQGLGDTGDSFHRDSVTNADIASRLARGGVTDPFNDAEIRNKLNFQGLQGLGSPFASSESNQIQSSQPPMSAASQTPFTAGPTGSGYFARAQDQDSASNQMPASQQRQMVMPDRMRWIYRDPQGNTQGPWSGLEMHDWYKAGFFSPELQVKKLEDADYEPLAQLIRRIGNSREPFLVPQIGIPHGSSTAQANSSTATSGAVPAATPSTAQPPFASSFPSFGTTLSAEQQNALERRKQEEQYLMARQKEHLAQQQVLMKQMQHMQGGQLHHHSSAHSLQSQPSYGSITSPMGYQPSPAQGPIQPPAAGPLPGFFDTSIRNAGPLGAVVDPMSPVREEDLPGFMERLNMGRGGQPTYSQEGQSHQQHVAAMMQERARQQREQEQYEMMQRDDDQRITAERLEQYHMLRAQEEAQQYQQPGTIGGSVHRQVSDQNLSGQLHRDEAGIEYEDETHSMREDLTPKEPLSLSEQVQKAAATQPQSPWAKIDSGLPQPFPPPQSTSPMPAPTPQRNRQSVADALNAESQSPSRTESVEPQSAAVAPWAKEIAEGMKGPSLKEIQAMEARKAAQQEEIAAAARRAVAEQERQNQQSQPLTPAPGLPSSANWASSISPAVPATTGTSAWSKPAAGKPTIATPVTGAKKTLAQIQKEEEARKSRAAAAAAAANAVSSVSNIAATVGGKRYADLASKGPMPTPLQPSNAAWTTVGAGGKVKTPTAPAPGLNTRTVSGGIVQPSASVAKPKAATSAAAKGPGSQHHANEEFQRWTKSALSKGLNSNISGTSHFSMNYTSHD